MTTTLTYQNLLAEAREILQDTNTDPTLQRYSDSTLLVFSIAACKSSTASGPMPSMTFGDPTTSDFDVPMIVSVVTPGGVLWTAVFELPRRSTIRS